MKTTLCSLLIATWVVSASAQPDSVARRYNIIKLNLVSSFLYDQSGAVSFERVAKPNQTWAVTLGFVMFPRLGSFGSSVVDENYDHTGYMVGGEYRFYLKKENKFLAPRGVYIGPYTSFYSFKNSHDLILTSSSGAVTQANMKADLTALNIGLQLGYQFILNNRWTIEAVFFGPSVSRYALKMNLTGNFDVTEEDILANNVLKALTDKFPLIKDLLLNQSANMHGTTSTWSTGFRYQLNVGYHFGRK